MRPVYRFGRLVLLWLPMPRVWKQRIKAFLFRNVSWLRRANAYASWTRSQLRISTPTPFHFPPSRESRDLELPALFDATLHERQDFDWLGARDELVRDFARHALLVGDLRSVTGSDWPARLSDQQRRTSARQLAALRSQCREGDDGVDVSIVIPVLNQIDMTLTCLRALVIWGSRYRFEIIVVDDGSADATQGILAGLEAVRYVRNEENVGFLRACNRGASLARGRYLVLLNNDTVVLPRWLDELVDTLEAIPDAGLVGSKLLSADGTLQEAGGIVWADASGWNFGRGDDPKRPRYNYLRDVDYASGCSIAMPTALWRSLDGFDERYAPAYYEDTDLAFRVREAGYRTLYQPLSVVFHHDGASAGDSPGVGVKRYQALNRPVFLARWERVLAGHGSSGAADSRARDRRARFRVLVVDAVTPTPDMDSGSLDCLGYLEILERLGCHVTFVPENLVHAGHYTEALQRLGVECLYYPYVTSLRAAVDLLAGELDLALVCRVPVASRIVDRIRDSAPDAKIVFDTVDLHFLREEREAAVTGSERRRRAASRTKARELAVMRKSDTTVVRSRYERDLVRTLAPEVRCRVIPGPREAPGRGPVAWCDRRDVLFLGGYQHAPNVDAAMFLVERVWPAVRARRTGARLVLAGSRMPPAIESLAAKDILTPGFLPDLASVLDGVRLTVAPLRFGSGIKGKVLSSLSHGVPCIATSIAIEGTGLEPGRHLLSADEPADIADLICRAYQEPDLWRRLSDEGLDACRASFSIGAVTERIAAAFAELGMDLSAGPTARVPR